MNILNIVKNNINSIYVKYIKNDEIIEEPIFYIAGAQTLPPPLPEEEEEYYIKKLSDEDNLEARQMLIERNLRLVVYIAKKFEVKISYILINVILQNQTIFYFI